MSQQPGSQSELPPPRRFEVALFALLVLSCSQLGYVGHPRYGPFIAAADVLCALLTIAWMWKVTREGRWRSLTWPPFVVWAWLVLGVLSMSKSMVDAEGNLSPGGIKAGVVEVAQLGLYFFAGYMLFVDVLNSTAKMRRAAAVLLGAVTLVVLWGLADYALVAEKPFDVKSSFGNRNVYSAFLVMTLPLLFGGALHERSRVQRWWVLGLVAVALVTMVGPPHVWILTAVLAWIAYVRGGRVRTYLAPALVVFALAVNLGLPMNRTTNVVEFLDPFERGELYKLEAGAEAPVQDSLIVKKRWLEWQPALQMLTENFPLGVGAGSYQRRIGEAQYYGPLPNVKKSEPDTNNLYLVVGASTGFAALICLVGFLTRFWRQSRVLWLKAGSTVERGLAAGLPGAVLGLTVANLFTSLLVRGVSLVWAFLFAMVTVLLRERLSVERKRDTASHSSDQP